MSETTKDKRPGHSTGPRSDDGKQNSSRNAVTHGLCAAKFILIPGETEEGFEAHAQSWAAGYEGFHSPLLQPLLQDVIQAHWLQKRAYKQVFESEMALAMAESNHDSPETAEAVFKRLQRMNRYKTAYENSFQRAFRCLEAFRKREGAEAMSRLRALRIRHSIALAISQLIAREIRSGATPEHARETVGLLHPEPTRPPTASQSEKGPPTPAG